MLSTIPKLMLSTSVLATATAGLPSPTPFSPTAPDNHHQSHSSIASHISSFFGSRGASLSSSTSTSTDGASASLGIGALVTASASAGVAPALFARRRGEERER